MRGISSGLVLVCLGGGVAGASPFVNMDRQDDTSIVGGELLYSNVDESDVTLMRFDGHFQYVAPSGLGVYGTLPIAYGSDNNNSYTLIGNIDVGGIYNIRSNAETTIVLHGGLTLPTASDDLGDFLIGVSAGQLRVEDEYQWLPKSTSLRLAVSPVYRSGKLFLRGDAGIDVNMDHADIIDPNNLLHLDFGVGGWITPEFALTGELTSLIAIDGDDNTDNAYFNLAVGGRYNAGGVSPYFGIVIPTDNDISDNIPWGVILGLDAKI